ncbi:unnamed protein product [Cuscuta campestris]|uniref:C2H2-type domain-containing protein n=1 Tax=Cuscuta campestris TaxID=132261 RepID=A0A484NNL8_9ASTE|nr:C2H2 zinc finger family protein [Cuscuta campestris]VFR01435.1 unnamed protein product [Cuscuta campestris]
MMSGDVFSIPSCLKPILLPDPQDPNPKPNPPSKRRRNLPGTPDPDAEVIALSPKSLMATNRFVCEICNKGFQRDQNLQLHRRGHNLPWKLKQRARPPEVVRRKVYICPEKSCVHHEPSRALGDLTGIKKHFSRKHGEKKWKCDKCSKKYAVHSDWKAHSKTCGTREYKCDCGTLFSRKDSFITHRAFCDALAEESARITSVAANSMSFRNGNESFLNLPPGIPHFPARFQPDFPQKPPRPSLWLDNAVNNNNSNNNNSHHHHHHLTGPDLHQMSGKIFGGISSGGLPDMLHMDDSPATIMYPPPPSSIENFGTANLSLASLPRQHDQGGGGGGEMVAETLNSMYSSRAPMSATALLQRAAQIGSTKSNPAFFGNGFGLMTSASSSSSNNNLPGFIRGNESGAEHSSPCLMQGRRQHHHGGGVSSLLSAGVNLTRDFLGMGNEGGRPFMDDEELAKFASSMGSSAGAMDLGTHFGTDDADDHHLLLHHHHH